MIPLVDIVLLLLVILALAAPRPRPACSRVLEVSIDVTGDVFVAGERVDEAGLRARVHEARRRDAALVARICADENAAHGRVLHVLGVLHEAWASTPPLR